MKTQTSIDWLAEQLDKAIKEFLKTLKPTDTIIDKAHSLGAKYQDSVNAARKMHREEVVNSFTKGQLDIIEVIMPIPDEIKVDTEDGENYYTQTFETP